MGPLTILEYPDPRLRTRAQPVERFDAELGRLIDAMFQLMYAVPGIGLAATQVDVHKRLIILDISEEHNQPRVYINPEILERGGAAKTEEGCLSVPGVFEDVERAERVRVRAQDRDGTVFERELAGMEAVCLQHEMDHLEGKLFVDYLSDLKRERIRKKLDRDRRERSAPRGREGSRAARAY